MRRRFSGRTASRFQSAPCFFVSQVSRFFSGSLFTAALGPTGVWVTSWKSPAQSARLMPICTPMWKHNQSDPANYADGTNAKLIRALPRLIMEGSLYNQLEKAIYPLQRTTTAPQLLFSSHDFRLRFPCMPPRLQQARYAYRVKSIKCDCSDNPEYGGLDRPR